MKIKGEEVSEERLALLYRKVFNSEDGQTVLEHIRMMANRASLDYKEPNALVAVIRVAQQDLVKAIEGWSKP